MKKICICLLTLLILLMLTPVFVVADAEYTSNDMVHSDAVPGEPLTWAYLATIAGATTATLLIVQFLKLPLDKVWKIPTRLFVYFVALAVLLVATAFTVGLTVDTALLTIVNAFIVALTAYGSYEITFRKLEN